MKRYVKSTCYKCDFSEGGNRFLCYEGLCANYEPAYVTIEVDENCKFGFSSLEEFDKVYGTSYAKQN